MCTNLVRTTSFQHTFHQRHIPKAFQHFPVSHSMLSFLFLLGYTLLVRINTHHSTVFRRAAKITFYRTALFLKISPHQSIILSFNRMLKELTGKKRLSVLVLGHQQQSRRILVYPVYKQWICIRTLQMIQQAVDQCTIPIAHTRMQPEVPDLDSAFVAACIFVRDTPCSLICK